MTNNKKTKKEIKIKRRYLIFGPGFLFTLVFAGILYYENIYKRQPPQIIKTKISSKTTITPEVDFLLEIKGLNLSDKQINQIKKNYKDYKKQADPLKKQLKQEAKIIKTYFKENENKKLSLTEIQKQTYFQNQLSNDFYNLRKWTFEKANLILNNNQKKLVKNTLKNLKYKDLKKIYSRMMNYEK